MDERAGVRDLSLAQDGKTDEMSSLGEEIEWKLSLTCKREQCRGVGAGTCSH